MPVVVTGDSTLIWRLALIRAMPMSPQRSTLPILLLKWNFRDVGRVWERIFAGDQALPVIGAGLLTLEGRLAVRRAEPTCAVGSTLLVVFALGDLAVGEAVCVVVVDEVAA